MISENMKDELFSASYPVLIEDLIFAGGLAETTVKEGAMVVFDYEDDQYYPMGNIVQGTHIRNGWGIAVPLPYEYVFDYLLLPYAVSSSRWEEVKALVVVEPLSNWFDNPYKQYGFAPAVTLDFLGVKRAKGIFAKTGELTWA